MNMKIINDSLNVNLYHSNKEKTNSVEFNKVRLTVNHGKPPKKSYQAYEKIISLNKLIKNKFKTNRSIHDIYDYQRNLIDAAILALNKMGEDSSILISLSNQLDASKFKENRAATDKEIEIAKQLRNNLVNLISKSFLRNKHSSFEAKKLANITFKEALIDHLNNKNWRTIKNNIIYAGKIYLSKQQPASKMKLGKDDIFPISYSDKGICSSSTKETYHATNLWKSSISIKENGINKTLFEGIRHGVLSPYELPENSYERTLGARNRGREVVTAALFSQPHILDKALKGEPVKLRLVSTSLLTNSKIGNEKKMLRDQIKVWEALSNQQIMTLKIRDKQGQIQNVKVNLEVSAFNFGVNELALKFGLGNSASDFYNSIAMQKLLGDDLEPNSTPGGWVGEYLKGNPDNVDKVLELSKQIKTIWKNKWHHVDEGEPYKASKRIAMLAYEIKAVPCWNCKSGKDRTGMLDSEIKQEVISYNQRIKLSKPGSPYGGINNELMKEVFTKSGNQEIQYCNTGAKGNKVIKNIPLSFLNLSYEKRIDDKNVLNSLKGLSSLFKG
ncbi:type III secretion system effector inositol phosphate phosphatase [Candidatus Arsenophonus triatominarum]|uniref:type III secretion system effector inositol phosphate phosphatase n=1 Tax=Candidatus Arsenophonus triatominarum TaxID=57911 RepID=UPI00164FB903|nr:type III secretion system effector inositol phosphate phosphatase [Candidatus Arsenophonus triatominarum]